MRLLCNLPLECFEERARWPDFDLVTFGPAGRMRVDGVLYPFDVEFDPSRQTLEELYAKLPPGERPDAILIWWPDQEPLPEGLDKAPCPVVGIVSDYNLSLPAIAGLWPYFDLLLVDKSGVDVFRRLSFAAVEPFCQFTFKQPFHKLYDGIDRDLDVGFAGNLNKVVQGERALWLSRLLQLRTRGLSVEVRTGIVGPEYGRFLNRARIGWNRSIRGEMNLRAFEVPACGAMLMLERENLEVRDHFAQDHEVILYGDDDLEDLVMRYSLDDAARERVARAGAARVREYTMGRRLEQIAELVEARLGSRPRATDFELALGRATAMLGTWATPAAALQAIERAIALEPNDPRAWNLRALCWLRADPHAHAQRALADLGRALATTPTYLPAAANLVELLERGGRPDLAIPARAELERRNSLVPSWTDVDGLLFPLGYTARNVAAAHALAAGVREGTPSTVGAAITDGVPT